MKKTSVKVLALLLALLMTGLCGCVLEKDDPSESSEPEQLITEELKNYKVGFVQYDEHESLNSIRETFMSRIEAWGYTPERIAIDYQNAKGSVEEAERICTTFVKQDVDMIVAVATPAAKAAVAAAKDTDIIVLFSGVSNPAGDLGMANLDAPSGNVTGVSDVTAIKAIIDLAKQSKGGSIQTLGLLYNPNEPSALGDVATARSFCQEQGITLVEELVTERAKFPEAATRICDEAEVVFLPMDNSAATVFDSIQSVFLEKEIPLFVGSSTLVKGGALAGVSIDYAEMGAYSADMAVALLEGQPVSKTPVLRMEKGQIYINQTTLETLKIHFPDETQKRAIYFQ